MMEKAYKPQFYKGLSYNQQRDIIPKRRREWAGERVSQLAKVKLYEHPEDYKDMMYSLAIPESNPIYPTFRVETGQWRHPSFDVLTRREEPAEIANPQIMILNFNGTDGTTTYEEEIAHLSPSTNTYIELDEDQVKFGTASLKLSGNATKVSALNYTIPATRGDLTIHGWYYFESFDSSDAGNYQRLIYAYKNGGDYYPTIEIVAGESPAHFIVNIYDSAGNSSYTTYDIPFVTGQWHHVALVMRGATISLYIDGTLFFAWESSVAAPWDGIDFIQVAYRYSPSVNNWGTFWVDAYEITNYAKWTKDFTPPLNPPAPDVVTK